MKRIIYYFFGVKISLIYILFISGMFLEAIHSSNCMMNLMHFAVKQLND